MSRDPLKQALGELLVVGQPRLPHQRRVGREARYPLICREREDRIQVGPVRKYLDAKLVNHRDSFYSLSARITFAAAAKLRTIVSGWGVAVALVSAAGVLDQRRTAPGRPPCGHVPVGVADHPRSSRVEVELPRRLEQHPRSRLAAFARAHQLRNDPLRVVQAQLERIEADPLGGEQLQHPGVYGLELLKRDQALCRRRLVGHADQPPAGVCQAPQRADAPGTSLISPGRSGDSGRPLTGSGTSSLMTPSRSTNTAPRPLTCDLRPSGSPSAPAVPPAPDAKRARARRRPGRTRRAAS